MDHHDQFITEVKKCQRRVSFSTLQKAYNFAYEAHKGQKRHSGEPYFTHPARVALELLRNRFDTHTIAAALLHDVLEDTSVTTEDLLLDFDPDIVTLVEGVTKLNKIHFSTIENAKVENFRKLVLSFTDDIRVLVIKLFDRLDNIRTIFHIEAEDKRKRIALETMSIYVPLFERLSFHDYKDEIEDTCFKVLEERSYQSILAKIDQLKIKTSLFTLDDIKHELMLKLKDGGVKNFTIFGRIKRPYSIWQKMKRTHKPFENLFDIVAFRIVVDTDKDCYQVFYLLHKNYKSAQESFRDYISNPKPNYYQSLHTCILIAGGVKIEVQIRTTKMHEFAERGIAAHWNYKNPVSNVNDWRKYYWMRNLIDIINEKDISYDDIYDYSKIEFFHDQIFVFTPELDVINLPINSCALDFAYAIHTKIGNSCSKAIIDDIECSKFTKLVNGSTIRIITSTEASPEAFWLSFVKTGVAKLSIKKYLRHKHREAIRSQAYAILAYFFENINLNFQEELIPAMLKLTNIKEEASFLEKIIEGSIDIKSIIRLMFSNLPTPSLQEVDYKDAIGIGKLNIDVNKVYCAHCCYPVYGDPVIGVKLPEDSLEIHNSSCERLYTDSTSNLSLIPVYWKNSELYYYIAMLDIYVLPLKGSFIKLINKIFDKGFRMQKVHIDNSVFDHRGNIRSSIHVEVKSVEDLQNLINDISKSDFVYSVSRVTSRYKGHV